MWLGRWSNCDPIMLDGGINIYGYALNNPVCMLDRLGMQPKPAIFPDPIDSGGLVDLSPPLSAVESSDTSEYVVLPEEFVIPSVVWPPPLPEIDFLNDPRYSFDPQGPPPPIGWFVEADDPDSGLPPFRTVLQAFFAGIDAIANVGAGARKLTTVVKEVPVEAELKSAAMEVKAAEGTVFFRGTSEGFEGSPGLQRLGVTPATSDPVVGTIFATEGQNFGRGVLHVATPADLKGVTISEGNMFAQRELEVAIELSPKQFADRASTTISAAEARSALHSIGVKVPSSVRGFAVDVILENTPRLTKAEIDKFLTIIGVGR